MVRSGSPDLGYEWYTESILSHVVGGAVPLYRGSPELPGAPTTSMYMEFEDDYVKDYWDDDEKPVTLRCYSCFKRRHYCMFVKPQRTGKREKGNEEGWKRYCVFCGMWKGFWDLGMVHNLRWTMGRIKGRIWRKLRKEAVSRAESRRIRRLMALVEGWRLRAKNSRGVVFTRRRISPCHYNRFFPDEWTVVDLYPEIPFLVPAYYCSVLRPRS
ncbi:hypothetical protein MGYG_00145 [Nannizzia gypsea CBS 118893]|uniref:Uncharacterized protein n=1 Tax=Arthroderma gypseum (strain ATCC MYA-4604 / CBS 118893) TaxID=535722 RepID=E5R373_ARTGP|nr:hypothetical protein MGYG_00145 [Nannizzia gypsea CBS 118893]EFQ97102.1 hypothetical protein MGYG_00145 [Nannizzia gypsea CBS 118893]